MWLYVPLGSKIGYLYGLFQGHTGRNDFTKDALQCAVIDRATVSLGDFAQYLRISCEANLHRSEIASGLLMFKSADLRTSLGAFGNQCLDLLVQQIDTRADVRHCVRLIARYITAAHETIAGPLKTEPLKTGPLKTGPLRQAYCAICSRGWLRYLPCPLPTCCRSSTAMV